MKTHRSFTITSLLVTAALVLSACGAAGGGIPGSPGQVVDTYNDLIALYQHGRRAASDFRLCVDTGMGAINISVSLVQTYTAADVEKAKVWRQALDNSSARLLEALKNYRDANGNPIPADKIDLNALMQAGALPDKVGGGFTLFVQAFTEAPLPPVSPEPVLAAMRTANEQMNKINGCGDDWNKAAEAYNVRRSQVPGDIVGSLAQKLGVKELPAELPYYGGDYGGSISNPNLPSPTPAK